MCVRCARHARNARPRSVRPGFIHALVAGEIRRKYPTFPFFWERAANLAVEATMFYTRRSRTDRSHYRRSGRNHSKGE